MQDNLKVFEFFRRIRPLQLLNCLTAFGLFWALLNPSSCFAFEIEDYEISGVETSGVLINGTMSRDAFGMSCYFSRSTDFGKSWGTPEVFRHEGFKIGGNPTLAVDQKGNIYRMCMSAQPDYSEGVLDMSMSSDSGKTWSPWWSSQRLFGKIPDKPRLAAGANGQLALSFTEIEIKPGLVISSLTQIMQSSDQGKSWAALPIKTAAGGQGSFITYKSNILFGSWGTYENGPIRFLKYDSKTIFESTVAKDSDVNVPSTEIHVDPKTNRIIVLWSDTHSSFNPIFFSYSDDEGRTWSKKTQISEQGTMLSGAFDNNGVFNFVWTQAHFTGESVDLLEGFNFEMASSVTTLSRQFSKSKLGPTTVIKEKKLPNTPIYLGANQTVLKTNDGKLIGLIIDWTSGIGRINAVLLP